MTKKERIKKWLKENYKTLILKIVLGIFILLLVFEQIKTCSNNIVRDSVNAPITKRMHINTDGNYVSDNLLNISNFETNANGVNIKYDNNTFVLDGTSESGDYIFNLDTDIVCNGTYYMRFYNINGSYNSTDGAIGLYVFNTLGTWDFDSWQMSSATFIGSKTMSKMRIYVRGSFDNLSFNVAIYNSNRLPNDFEPYGLIYYSQEYINNHYVSNEENEKQNNIAYNNGLTTNLQKAVIDLLDTSSISGVYTYDGNNSIDYSANYYDSEQGIRVEDLPSKKGIVIQYNKKNNVDTLRFDISSSSFVANDNWEYNYFKVYCYNSDNQSYVNLNAFTINDGQININQTINNNLVFDKIIIGFDYLSPIAYTFENITLHSQVDHVYTSYYDTIYNLGYNEAIVSGESYNNGYKNGFVDGEKSGIYQGQLMQTEFSIGDIMKSIISAPVEVFGATLDFDIPGTNINIFSIIKLVVSLCVIGFAIKFFRS